MFVPMPVTPVCAIVSTFALTYPDPAAVTAIAVIRFPEHVTFMVAPDPDCVVPPVTPILSAAIEIVPFVHVLLVHPDVQLVRRDPLKTPVHVFELQPELH
jgi:hypothetical protein